MQITQEQLFNSKVRNLARGAIVAGVAALVCAGGASLFADAPSRTSGSSLSRERRLAQETRDVWVAHYILTAVAGKPDQRSFGKGNWVRLKGLQGSGLVKLHDQDGRLLLSVGLAEQQTKTVSISGGYYASVRAETTGSAFQVDANVFIR